MSFSLRPTEKRTTSKQPSNKSASSHAVDLSFDRVLNGIVLPRVFIVKTSKQLKLDTARVIQLRIRVRCAKSYI